MTTLTELYHELNNAFTMKWTEVRFREWVWEDGYGKVCGRVYSSWTTHNAYAFEKKLGEYTSLEAAKAAVERTTKPYEVH